MKKHIFKPYSQSFPNLFQKESDWIASNVDIPIAIEYIGSTAVPGLGGKGIIDIGIATEKKDMELVSRKLQAIGYEYRPNFSTEERFYFIAYLPEQDEGTRRYHIHLTYPENPEWKNFLRFRDYLRSDSEALQEYAELKQQAVTKAKDEGERYRKIKEPMFKKINDKVSTLDKPVIRVMKENDRDILISEFCFPWSTKQATTEKWVRYWLEHQEKIRTVYLLENKKQLIGYASLLHISEYPNFKKAEIPEINDVWIVEDWRNQGFGKMLIRYLENSACRMNYKHVGIGFGFYADYGAAQELYVHLGYSPDGCGVTYKYQPTVPDESYPLDDELILWLKKDL